MNDLSAKKCAPCEGGVAPLTAAQAAELRAQLHPEWQIAGDAKSLHALCSSSRISIAP